MGLKSVMLKTKSPGKCWSESIDRHAHRKPENSIKSFGKYISIRNDLMVYFN